ncbi:unnamed protein product [Rotaria sordida]|uniref:Uncharacterized protein n=1 Tax=Rotaria sordida TaxID=392033 RepID=A0A814IHQ9_9BILA|nr:unnamed protein product [Rotaria sordida]CAF1105590.1 unnamed protein product [Rotaria sordida]CAF3946141.1 unnamed protein product [Rotaria sordida]CAF4077096.1 unnamed protein product [Rotaria sordida]
MCAFILLIELWHFLSHSRRFIRCLPHAVQQKFINQDFLNSSINNSITLANDPNDDIIRTLTTGSELPLVGSTRLLNNTI